MGSTSSQYIPSPSAVPGATDVSSGTTEDSESSLTKAFERQRKRRGISSTYRSTGSSSASSTSGKTKLGE